MKRAVLAIVLTACGGHPEPAPAPKSCTKNLPPRTAPLTSPDPQVTAAPPEHSSRLVADVELPLASITRQLDAQVSTRLAEQRDLSVGAAGRLDYTVDRGPFTATVENDALVIRTDIHAHAEACRSHVCYASCAPEGHATATVSLRLGPDYRFAPARVGFVMTRGCEVRALGGLLTVDVTPMIVGEIRPRLRQVEHDIDAKLPVMRPQAEKLWTELATPRALPLGGGCAYVHATSLVEGPIEGTPDALRVRLGLVAAAEIRARACEAVDPPAPLPPLAQDPALPADDDVVLTLVSGLDQVARAVDAAAVLPSGKDLLVDVHLHGETCGDAAATASVAWTDDGKALHFQNASWLPSEASRVSGLSPTVVSTPTFAPALPPSALEAVLPTAAAAMSDDHVSVRASVATVKPLTAYVRGSDVAAAVVVRGHLALTEAHN